jgi:hypothetical protein
MFMKSNELEVRKRKNEKESSKCEVEENVGNQLRNKVYKIQNCLIS